MIWKLFWLFGAIYNTGASINSFNNGYVGLSVSQCICGMFLLGCFIWFGVKDFNNGKGFWS